MLGLEIHFFQAFNIVFHCNFPVLQFSMYTSFGVFSAKAKHALTEFLLILKTRLRIIKKEIFYLKIYCFSNFSFLICNEVTLSSK